MEYQKLFSLTGRNIVLKDVRFEEALTTTSHANREWEQVYLHLVMTGDLLSARNYLQQLLSAEHKVHIGNSSNGNLTQAKFLAVSFITFVCRSAIYSGADAIITNQQCERFLHFLETCGNVYDIVHQLFYFSESMIQQVHSAHFVQKNDLYLTLCCEYIETHLSEKITLSSLAELCGITPNYLSALFKKSTGITITQYILEQRIEIAKQLLRTPEYTLSEIATSLGFCSQSYFVVCFKKLTGVTPLNWRICHTTTQCP